VQQAKPIIVIRKKSGHGGHHGGAWKVAYADFVTALMSLFIVLWLMNTSQKIRQAVAGYFNDPRGTTALTGTDQSGSSENLALTENNVADLKRKIEQAIHHMNDLKALENQIQITITPEGLRIELLETKDGTFFDTGSARLNQHGQELLEMLAGQLGQVPNRISIEGHTDAQPYASPDGYGNWELSTDRANAARRVMETSGLRERQVSQVRGYADQKLRVPDNPMDPSNRRISLIVQYLTADAPPVPAGAGPVSEKQAGGAGAGAEGGSAQKPMESPGANAAPNAAKAAAPSPAVTKAQAGAKPSAAQTQSLVARLLAKLHKGRGRG
jgi:chemotaxis protein MotB